MTWNIVKPGSVSELLLNRNCKTVFFLHGSWCDVAMLRPVR